MHLDPDRTESRIDRLTLTVDEVAQMLGLSRSATYEAIARGEIPSLRFGRRIVVTQRALHRMLGPRRPTDRTSIHESVLTQYAEISAGGSILHGGREGIPEQGGRGMVGLCEEVAVHVQCRRRIPMTEATGHGPHVDSARQQLRSDVVAQVV